MKIPSLNECRRPPGILGAIGGRNQRGDVWEDTTEVLLSTGFPSSLDGRIYQWNAITVPRGVPLLDWAW